MSSLAAPILRLAALRDIEARHADDDLMGRAGAATADWAADLCGSHGGSRDPILIVAGPGNNGGDALVAARHLKSRFFEIVLVLAAEPTRLPAAARAAYAAWMELGARCSDSIPAGRWSLVIDGLFGVGLTRPIADSMALLVRRMQQAAHDSGCPLLAIDCPSGLNSETGQPLGETVVATHTLSFIALKPGLLTASGPDHCGELKVDDLGLGLGVACESPPAACGHTIGRANIASALVRRPRDSHKGSFGSAGVLGGAPGMLGAALLAGRAALNLGSGRVFLGLIDAHAPRVDPGQPELMLRGAAALFDAPLTALAAGPGMGTGSAAKELLAQAIDLPLPLILDADALNLLTRHPALREALIARSELSLATVLTPHPAEAARLLDITIAGLQENRLDAALQLARIHSAWVVLKGCGSVVASPGGQWWINTTGNPGLATAGSGDVLSGIMLALLAQERIDTGTAVRLAVHLHGAAADRWAAEHAGEIGLTAGEVIPAARRLLNEWVAECT